jgi:mono/diheme cytochrome c family protein
MPTSNGDGAGRARQRREPWLDGVAVAVGAGVLVLAPARASAADRVPDPALVRGEHIARYECSACHVVAKDQEFPVLLNKPAPPFSEIANRPGTSAGTLRNFITMTHWDAQTIPMTMPSTNLPKQDVAAVVRYILSLQQR